MLIDIDKIYYVAKYTNRVENLLEDVPLPVQAISHKFNYSCMNNVVLDDMLRNDTGIFFNPLN